ncbi:MAG: aminotransferase class I/II-fold pyridoxal phosphate-dependent enzyme [Candidatus Kapaibacterium sp.]
MSNNNNIFSDVAKGLSSLSISSIADTVNKRKAEGTKIYNLTIGDFNPEYFPIPKGLEDEIINAYREKLTNYPVVGGMPELLEAVSSHIKHFGNFDYSSSQIITGSGARVLSYLLFRTLINKGDKVINVVPSWNNYNYIQLCGADEVTIETKPENKFLLTADELKPHIKDASLIALNSPSNPAGTTFDRGRLKEIFDIICDENRKRKQENRKLLYVFFDIVYWLLTFGETKFINPIEECEKAKEYIVFVDGISKCFAATGVRVGWAFGPEPIISKMKQMNAHVGGWSPKPEQIAVAKFLNRTNDVEVYISNIKKELFQRLYLLYECFSGLKKKGFCAEIIAPQGALYLSVKLDLIGSLDNNKKSIESVNDITTYFLDNLGIALVPFCAFGADRKSLWFRISVGSCSISDVKEVCNILNRNFYI